MTSTRTVDEMYTIMGEISFSVEGTSVMQVLMAMHATVSKLFAADLAHTSSWHKGSRQLSVGNIDDDPAGRDSDVQQITLI